MKKLTVKEIIKCKGSRKLSEVYTHNPIEAEACEAAGIEMIVSSELNDIDGIRNSAKNTFLTVGLKYGSYLNEFEILKRSFELINIGADAIYCPHPIFPAYFFAFVICSTVIRNSYFIDSDIHF